MRNLQVSLLSAALTALCLSTTPGTAQILNPSDFQPRNDAGLGSIKRSFNATQLVDVPFISCTGQAKACALTAGILYKGRFWILGREGWSAAAGGGAFSEFTNIYEWTVDGAFVATHAVPLPPDAGPEDVNFGRWFAPPNVTRGRAPEVRDMGSDQEIGGETVMIGSEEGIYLTRLDSATGDWELYDQVLTANGLKTVAAGDFENPIRGAGLDTLRALGDADNNGNDEGEGYMGLAYDPAGNGGEGSFWVSADDGLGNGGWIEDPDNAGQTIRGPSYNPSTGTGGNHKPLLEIDLNGNILTTHVNNPDPDPGSPTFGEPRGGWWVAGGLQIDPQSGNLWVAADMVDQIIEVDINTGVPTGGKFSPPFPDPMRQGGLTGITNGDPGSYPSSWDLLAFTNVDGDDFFTTVRMHQYPNLNGLTEPFLQASVNALPLGTTPPIVFTNKDTLHIKLNQNGRPMAPALLMFDFGDDVNSDAETALPLGVLPELRVHSSFSAPVHNGSAIQTTFAVGQQLDVDLSAIGFPVQTGLSQIRTQAVYLDLRSQYSPGLMVSNEVWFAGIGINQVLVEMKGSTSYNADRSSGFFRVHWLKGPDIVKVVLDMDNGSTNFDVDDAVFDTDQMNMADGFGLGDSTLPGCAGTYRNGSDVTTGLVYDAMTNTVVSYAPATATSRGDEASICTYYAGQGQTWISGFVGTAGDNGGGDNYQVLEFNFTDFGLDGGNPAAAPEIFEFDCDTDDVLASGGGHTGIVVEITLSDGTVFRAETLPDSGDPTRSFIAW